MKTRLLTQDVWTEIALAASQAKKPACVAVAYCGKGAAKMLPLPNGSLLVVDASILSVKCGRTHPADLLTLAQRGVKVFSAPTLHAKVFAFDRALFVGSTNASRNSAENLMEAAITTNDVKLIRAAKSFVQNLCLEPLGEAAIKRLQKLYRPPAFEKATRARGSERLYVAKTWDEDFSTAVEQAIEADDAVAEGKRRKSAAEFEVVNLRWRGTPPFKAGQLLMQVKNGKLSPPGHVIHMKVHRESKGSSMLLWIETPLNKKWRTIAKLKPDIQALLNRAGFKSTNVILPLFVK